MFNRKEGKQRALKALRAHWVVFVFLCLLAGAVGTAHSGSFTTLSDGLHALTGNEVEEVNSRWRLDSAMNAVLENQISAKQASADLVQQEAEREQTQIGVLSIGHSEGVLALLSNQLSSGAFLITLLGALMAVLKNAEASFIVWILLAFGFGLLVYVFFVNLYRAICARFFLEGRIYEEVPMRRTVYFAYVHKWVNAASVLFVEVLYRSLWSLTIIGGIIKSLSYFCVPYIVAENPGLKANEVITMSRKMMDGHKMECFKLKLSFLGWWVLGVLTFGVSGILFSDPYHDCTMAEYYAYIREEGKKKGLCDSLQDRYLFEVPSEEVLKEAYGTVSEPAVCEEKGLAGFFGIRKYAEPVESGRDAYARYESLNRILSGRSYGLRLCPFHVKESKSHLEDLHYDRRYCIGSLVLLFGLFSLLGWVWEVSLHLIQYGNFVNRGVLHGPWLPIYGTGGLLVLVCLNKWRDKPVQEFFGAVVLCGFVEYMTAWALSVLHNGQEWWTYQGYFLNVDGRICAEGLLVFGIGAMLIVYFAAPLLDDLILRLKEKTLIVLAVVFLAVFSVDCVYSNVHPNTGDGVTSCVESEIIEDVG